MRQPNYVRPRTWKVLDDPPFIGDGKPIELRCKHCGTWAELPAKQLNGGIVIAVLGMGVIFDPAGFQPPDDWLPKEIKCRHCRRTFGSGE